MALHVESTVEKVSRYLNLLRLLLNSRVFLAEMVEHATILFALVKLLGSRSAYISLLASLALRNCLKHFSGNEGKLEAHVRRILVRGST